MRVSVLFHMLCSSFTTSFAFYKCMATLATYNQVLIQLLCKPVNEYFPQVTVSLNGVFDYVPFIFSFRTNHNADFLDKKLHWH